GQMHERVACLGDVEEGEEEHRRQAPGEQEGQPADQQAQPRNDLSGRREPEDEQRDCSGDDPLERPLGEDFDVVGEGSDSGSVEDRGLRQEDLEVLAADLLIGAVTAGGEAERHEPGGDQDGSQGASSEEETRREPALPPGAPEAEQEERREEDDRRLPQASCHGEERTGEEKRSPSFFHARGGPGEEHGDSSFQGVDERQLAVEPEERIEDVEGGGEHGGFRSRYAAYHQNNAARS